MKSQRGKRNFRSDVTDMTSNTVASMSFIKIKGQSLTLQLYPESSPALSTCPLLLPLLLHFSPQFTTILRTPKKTRTSGFPSSLEMLVLRVLHLTHLPTMVTCERDVVYYRAPRLTCVS
jgi:hypothetical protein